jgi:hypothetical protein
MPRRTAKARICRSKESGSMSGLQSRDDSQGPSNQLGPVDRHILPADRATEIQLLWRGTYWRVVPHDFSSRLGYDTSDLLYTPVATSNRLYKNAEEHTAASSLSSIVLSELCKRLTIREKRQPAQIPEAPVWGHRHLDQACPSYDRCHLHMSLERLWAQRWDERDF